MPFILSIAAFRNDLRRRIIQLVDSFRVFFAVREEDTLARPASSFRVRRAAADLRRVKRAGHTVRLGNVTIRAHGIAISHGQFYTTELCGRSYYPPEAGFPAGASVEFLERMRADMSPRMSLKGCTLLKLKRRRCYRLRQEDLKGQKLWKIMKTLVSLYGCLN